MTPRVWAKPGLKWEGFEPRAYVLDMDKVEKMTLRDDSTGRSTTLGEVLRSFQGEKVEVDDEVIETTLKSDRRTAVLKGPEFTRRLLQLFYWLAERDLSPFDILWFYYDHDWSLEDPDVSYSFFLVDKDKIIEQHYNLYDSPDNGFDPTLLVPSGGDTRAWSHERAWQVATEKYWYRKFYTDTRTGQLMVLRPDKPPLYHYPQGRWEIAAKLNLINTALWLILGLLALEFFFRYWK